MQFCVKSLSICLIILFTNPLLSIGQQHDLQLIAKEYLNLMEQNSFEEAALLFHYPEAYTVQKKKSEFNSVKDGLKNFKEYLGSIIQILDYIRAIVDTVPDIVQGTETGNRPNQRGFLTLERP